MSGWMCGRTSERQSKDWDGSPFWQAVPEMSTTRTMHEVREGTFNPHTPSGRTNSPSTSLSEDGRSLAVIQGSANSGTHAGKTGKIRDRQVQIQGDSKDTLPATDERSGSQLPANMELGRIASQRTRNRDRDAKRSLCQSDSGPIWRDRTGSHPHSYCKSLFIANIGVSEDRNRSDSGLMSV